MDRKPASAELSRRLLAHQQCRIADSQQGKASASLIHRGATDRNPGHGSHCGNDGRLEQGSQEACTATGSANATVLISAGAKADESSVLDHETKPASGVVAPSQLADKHLTGVAAARD